MKVFNLFFVACLLLGISSCQEEEIFSCNKEVNSWVNENLNEVRSMTRSEWKNLDESVKIGCYIAFTQQQRVNFWKDKFDEVLALSWSKEETEHIKLMRSFVVTHPIYFDYSREKTDEEIEKFEIFVYEWKKKAEVQFGWSKEIIGGLIATGNSLLDKKGTVQVNQSTIMTKAGGESCNCNTSSDWCNSREDRPYWKCGSGCKGGDGWGCGTLGFYSCNGTCYNANA